MARRLGAAPSPQSFGNSTAQAGARRMGIEKLVQPAGFAPASSEWRSEILALERWLQRQKRTNTAATLFLTSHPLVFHGGSFGVSGTPPKQALVDEVEAWDRVQTNRN